MNRVGTLRSTLHSVRRLSSSLIFLKSTLIKLKLFVFISCCESLERLANEAEIGVGSLKRPLPSVELKTDCDVVVVVSLKAESVIESVLFEF